MKPTTNKAVILFDSVCNLYNISLQFVLKHNKKHHFVFAALQSDVARDILLQYPVKITEKDSILLIHNHKNYSESTVALLIARQFTRFWKLLQVFWIILKFIRNPIYQFIAKNRYRWFGKKDVCMISHKNVANRFL